MSGDPIIKARLAKGGGVWQTEEMISQSGRNRWRGFPLSKPGSPYWVPGFVALGLQLSALMHHTATRRTKYGFCRFGQKKFLTMRANAH